MTLKGTSRAILSERKESGSCNEIVSSPMKVPKHVIQEYA
jgi:hypothetical protein